MFVNTILDTPNETNKYLLKYRNTTLSWRIYFKNVCTYLVPSDTWALLTSYYLVLRESYAGSILQLRFETFRYPLSYFAHPAHYLSERRADDVYMLAAEFLLLNPRTYKPLSQSLRKKRSSGDIKCQSWLDRWCLLKHSSQHRQHHRSNFTVESNTVNSFAVLASFSHKNI